MSNGRFHSAYPSWIRFTAFLTLLTFSLSSDLRAQTGTAAEFPVSVKMELIPDQITVPSEFGKIQEIYTAPSGNPAVILIQDAHGIPDAQRSIQKLIQYFGKKYGVHLVTLEGASSRMDMQIFQSFPDKELLKKTFQPYFEKGELTGTTAAAIFSPSNAETLFQGVENWALYEQGLGFYLKAMQSEPGLIEKVKFQKEALIAEKKKAYSSQLFEIDQLLENFYQNSSSLAEILKSLGGVQKPQEGSELALLLSEIEREGRLNRGDWREMEKIANQIRLSLRAKRSNDIAMFNQKYQEFRTLQISAGTFALFLKELSDRYSIPFEGSEALSHMMKNQQRLKNIEGTKIFKELEEYAQLVKESLFRNEEEKNLDKKSRYLFLLEKLSKLELTREEWNEIKAEIASSALGLLAMTTGMSSPKSLVGDPALDSRRKRAGMTNSFQYHLDFYQNAEKREETMLNNLLNDLSLRTKRSNDRAILVAGGFHTQGLTQRLKEKNISYVLLTPEIDSIPESIHYHEHMRGEVSWKKYFEVENGKIDLYKAFVRGARDRLLEKQSPQLLKSWRDQIIRDLAERGKIEKAGEYTGFLDEISKAGKGTLARAEHSQKISRFINSLRHLETSGQLTPKNVFQLLKPATMLGAYLVPASQSLLSADISTQLDRETLAPPTALSEMRARSPIDIASIDISHLPTAKEFFANFAAWESANPTKRLVVLVRHGQAMSNVFKYAQTNDGFSPLSSHGLKQREALAELVAYLKAQGIEFDAYITSDLERAYETLRPAYERSALKGVKLEMTDKLRERIVTPISFFPLSLYFGEPGLTRAYEDASIQTGYASLGEFFFNNALLKNKKRAIIGTHNYTVSMAVMNLLGIPASEIETFRHQVGEVKNLSLTIMAYDPNQRGSGEILVYGDDSYLDKSLKGNPRTAWDAGSNLPLYYSLAASRVFLNMVGKGNKDLVDWSPTLRAFTGISEKRARKLSQQHSASALSEMRSNFSLFETTRQFFGGDGTRANILKAEGYAVGEKAARELIDSLDLTEAKLLKSVVRDLGLYHIDHVRPVEPHSSSLVLARKLENGMGVEILYLDNGPGVRDIRPLIESGDTELTSVRKAATSDGRGFVEFHIRTAAVKQNLWYHSESGQPEILEPSTWNGTFIRMVRFLPSAQYKPQTTAKKAAGIFREIFGLQEEIRLDWVKRNRPVLSRILLDVIRLRAELNKDSINQQEERVGIMRARLSSIEEVVQLYIGSRSEARIIDPKSLREDYHKRSKPNLFYGDKRWMDLIFLFGAFQKELHDHMITDVNRIMHLGSSKDAWGREAVEVVKNALPVFSQGVGPEFVEGAITHGPLRGPYSVPNDEEHDLILWEIFYHHPSWPAKEKIRIAVASVGVGKSEGIPAARIDAYDWGLAAVILSLNQVSPTAGTMVFPDDSIYRTALASLSEMEPPVDEFRMALKAIAHRIKIVIESRNPAGLSLQILPHLYKVQIWDAQHNKLVEEDPFLPLLLPGLAQILKVQKIASLQLMAPVFAEIIGDGPGQFETNFADIINSALNDLSSPESQLRQERPISLNNIQIEYIPNKEPIGDSLMITKISRSEMRNQNLEDLIDLGGDDDDEDGSFVEVDHVVGGDTDATLSHALRIHLDQYVYPDGVNSKLETAAWKLERGDRDQALADMDEAIHRYSLSSDKTAKGAADLEKLQNRFGKRQATNKPGDENGALISFKPPAENTVPFSFVFLNLRPAPLEPVRQRQEEYLRKIFARVARGLAVDMQNIIYVQGFNRALSDSADRPPIDFLLVAPATAKDPGYRSFLKDFTAVHPETTVFIGNIQMITEKKIGEKIFQKLGSVEEVKTEMPVIEGAVSGEGIHLSLNLGIVGVPTPEHQTQIENMIREFKRKHHPSAGVSYRVEYFTPEQIVGRMRSLTSHPLDILWDENKSFSLKIYRIWLNGEARKPVILNIDLSQIASERTVQARLKKMLSSSEIRGRGKPGQSKRNADEWWLEDRGERTLKGSRQFLLKVIEGMKRPAFPHPEVLNEYAEGIREAAFWQKGWGKDQFGKISINPRHIYFNLRLVRQTRSKDLFLLLFPAVIYSEAWGFKAVKAYGHELAGMMEAVPSVKTYEELKKALGSPKIDQLVAAVIAVETFEGRANLELLQRLMDHGEYSPERAEAALRGLPKSRRVKSMLADILSGREILNLPDDRKEGALLAHEFVNRFIYAVPYAKKGLRGIKQIPSQEAGERILALFILNQFRQFKKSKGKKGISPEAFDRPIHGADFDRVLVFLWNGGKNWQGIGKINSRLLSSHSEMRSLKEIVSVWGNQFGISPDKHQLLMELLTPGSTPGIAAERKKIYSYGIQAVKLAINLYVFEHQGPRRGDTARSSFMQNAGSKQHLANLLDHDTYQSYRALPRLPQSFYAKHNIVLFLLGLLMVQGNVQGLKDVLSPYMEGFLPKASAGSRVNHQELPSKVNQVSTLTTLIRPFVPPGYDLTAVFHKAVRIFQQTGAAYFKIDRQYENVGDSVLNWIILNRSSTIDGLTGRAHFNQFFRQIISNSTLDKVMRQTLRQHPKIEFFAESRQNLAGLLETLIGIVFLSYGEDYPTGLQKASEFFHMLAKNYFKNYERIYPKRLYADDVLHNFLGPFVGHVVRPRPSDRLKAKSEMREPASGEFYEGEIILPPSPRERFFPWFPRSLQEYREWQIIERLKPNPWWFFWSPGWLRPLIYSLRARRVQGMPLDLKAMQEELRLRLPEKPLTENSFIAEVPSIPENRDREVGRNQKVKDVDSLKFYVEFPLREAVRILNHEKNIRTTSSSANISDLARNYRGKGHEAILAIHYDSLSEANKKIAEALAEGNKAIEGVEFEKFYEEFAGKPRWLLKIYIPINLETRVREVSDKAIAVANAFRPQSPQPFVPQSEMRTQKMGATTEQISQETDGLKKEIRFISVKSNLAILARILRDVIRLQEELQSSSIDQKKETTGILKGQLFSIREKAELYIAQLENSRLERERRLSARSEIRIPNRKVIWAIAMAGMMSLLISSDSSRRDAPLENLAPIPAAEQAETVREAEEEKPIWMTYELKNDAESVRGAILLTLDWLKSQDYPHPEILDRYREALKDATAEAKTSFIFGKFTGAEDFDKVEVVFGVNKIYDIFSLIQNAGIRSQDLLFEFAAIIAREAWGLEMHHRNLEGRKRIYPEMLRIYYDERREKLPNEIRLDDPRLLGFLKDHQTTRLDHVSFMIAGESFEGWHEGDTLEFGWRHGIYSPSNAERYAKQLPEDSVSWRPQGNSYRDHSIERVTQREFDKAVRINLPRFLVGKPRETFGMALGFHVLAEGIRHQQTGKGIPLTVLQGGLDTTPLSGGMELLNTPVLKYVHAWDKEEMIEMPPASNSEMRRPNTTVAMIGLEGRMNFWAQGGGDYAETEPGALVLKIQKDIDALAAAGKAGFLKGFKHQILRQHSGDSKWEMWMRPLEEAIQKAKKAHLKLKFHEYELKPGQTLVIRNLRMDKSNSDLRMNVGNIRPNGTTDLAAESSSRDWFIAPRGFWTKASSFLITPRGALKKQELTKEHAKFLTENGIARKFPAVKGNQKFVLYNVMGFYEFVFEIKEIRGNSVVFSFEENELGPNVRIEILDGAKSEMRTAARSLEPVLDQQIGYTQLSWKISLEGVGKAQIKKFAQSLPVVESRAELEHLREREREELIFTFADGSDKIRVLDWEGIRRFVEQYEPKIKLGNWTYQLREDNLIQAYYGKDIHYSYTSNLPLNQLLKFYLFEILGNLIPIQLHSFPRILEGEEPGRLNRSVHFEFDGIEIDAGRFSFKISRDDPDAQTRMRVNPSLPEYPYPLMDPWVHLQMRFGLELSKRRIQGNGQYPILLLPSSEVPYSWLQDRSNIRMPVPSPGANSEMRRVSEFVSRTPQEAREKFKNYLRDKIKIDAVVELKNRGKWPDMGSPDPEEARADTQKDLAEIEEQINAEIQMADQIAALDPTWNPEEENALTQLLIEPPIWRENFDNLSVFEPLPAGASISLIKEKRQNIRKAAKETVTKYWPLLSDKGLIKNLSQSALTAWLEQFWLFLFDRYQKLDPQSDEKRRAALWTGLYEVTFFEHLKDYTQAKAIRKLTDQDIQKLFASTGHTFNLRRRGAGFSHLVDFQITLNAGTEKEKTVSQTISYTNASRYIEIILKESEKAYTHFLKLGKISHKNLALFSIVGLVLELLIGGWVGAFFGWLDVVLLVFISYFALRYFHAKHHLANVLTEQARLLSDFPYDDGRFGPQSEMRLTSFAPALAGIRTEGTVDPLFQLSSEEDQGVLDFELAKKLVDFKALVGHRIMQFLPLTISSAYNSPYSVQSSRLIWVGYASVEAFAKKFGLAGHTDYLRFLSQYDQEIARLNRSRKVDYDAVARVKTEGLRVLWKILQSQSNFSPEQSQFLQAFEEFKRFFNSDKFRGRDHLLYGELKKEFLAKNPMNGWDWRTWSKFEAGLSDYGDALEKGEVVPQAIQKAKERHKDEIDFQTFVQFVLQSQSKELKKYAGDQGVSIAMDIPIALDGADNWLRPSLSGLKRENGYQRLATQGLPADPTYRSGQPWQFYYFDWNNPAAFDYVTEIFEYNQDLADIIRIDHGMGVYVRYLMTEDVDGVMTLEKLGIYDRVQAIRRQALESTGDREQAKREAVQKVSILIRDTIRGLRTSHPEAAKLLPSDAIDLTYDENGELREHSMITLAREVPQNEWGKKLPAGSSWTRRPDVVEKKVFHGKPVWDVIRVSPNTLVRDEGFLYDYLFPADETAAPKPEDSIRLGYYQRGLGEKYISEISRLAQEKGTVVVWEMLAGWEPKTFLDSLANMGLTTYKPVRFGLTPDSPYYPSRHPENALATGTLPDGISFRQMWLEEASMDARRAILAEYFPGWNEQTDARHLREFTPEVNDILLEMVYNSPASMVVSTWNDILGLSPEDMINDPNKSSGQFENRLPRPVSVENLLRAARGEASTPEAAAAVKRLRKAGQKRNRNSETLIPSDPQTGKNTMQLREVRSDAAGLAHSFLMDAYAEAKAGENLQVSVVMNPGSPDEREIPMRQEGMRWRIEWSPEVIVTDVPTAYEFQIKIVRNSTEQISEKGTLISIPFGSDWNPFSPDYVLKNILSSKSEMRGGKNIGPESQRARDFIEAFNKIDERDPEGYRILHLLREAAFSLFKDFHEDTVQIASRLQIPSVGLISETIIAAGILEYMNDVVWKVTKSKYEKATQRRGGKKLGVKNWRYNISAMFAIYRTRNDRLLKKYLGSLFSVTPAGKIRNEWFIYALLGAANILWSSKGTLMHWLQFDQKAKTLRLSDSYKIYISRKLDKLHNDFVKYAALRETTANTLKELAEIGFGGEVRSIIQRLNRDHPRLNVRDFVSENDIREIEKTAGRPASGAKSEMRSKKQQDEFRDYVTSSYSRIRGMLGYGEATIHADDELRSLLHLMNSYSQEFPEWNPLFDHDRRYPMNSFSLSWLLGVAEISLTDRSARIFSDPQTDRRNAENETGSWRQGQSLKRGLHQKTLFGPQDFRLLPDYISSEAKAGDNPLTLGEVKALLRRAFYDGLTSALDDYGQRWIESGRSQREFTSVRFRTLRWLHDFYLHLYKQNLPEESLRMIFEIFWRARKEFQETAPLRRWADEETAAAIKNITGYEVSIRTKGDDAIVSISSDTYPGFNLQEKPFPLYSPSKDHVVFMNAFIKEIESRIRHATGQYNFENSKKSRDILTLISVISTVLMFLSLFSEMLKKPARWTEGIFIVSTAILWAWRYVVRKRVNKEVENFSVRLFAAPGKQIPAPVKSEVEPANQSVSKSEMRGWDDDKLKRDGLVFIRKPGEKVIIAQHVMVTKIGGVVIKYNLIDARKNLKIYSSEKIMVYVVPREEFDGWSNIDDFRTFYLVEKEATAKQGDITAGQTDENEEDENRRELVSSRKHTVPFSSDTALILGVKSGETILIRIHPMNQNIKINIIAPKAMPVHKRKTRQAIKLEERDLKGDGDKPSAKSEMRRAGRFGRWLWRVSMAWMIGLWATELNPPTYSWLPIPGAEKIEIPEKIESDPRLSELAEDIEQHEDMEKAQRALDELKEFLKKKKINDEDKALLIKALKFAMDFPPRGNQERQVRIEAMQLFVPLGDLDAVDYLIERQKIIDLWYSDSFSSAADEVIRELGHLRVIQHLSNTPGKGLQHPKWEVRNQAVTVITRLWDRATSKEITELTIKIAVQHIAFSDDARKFLDSQLRKGDHAKFVREELTKSGAGVNSEDFDVQRMAYVILAEDFDEASIRKLFYDAIRSKDIKKRGVAMAALRGVSPYDMSYLSAMLQEDKVGIHDEDPQIRVIAFHSLGLAGTSSNTLGMNLWDAFFGKNTGMNDPNEEVRKEALRALERVTDREDPIGDLLPEISAEGVNLKHPDPKVRKAISKLHLKLGNADSAVKELTTEGQGIYDADPDVRLAAVQSIGTLLRTYRSNEWPQDLLDKIVKILEEDRDPKIRATTISFFSYGNIFFMQKLLLGDNRGAHDPEAVVRRQAMETLSTSFRNAEKEIKSQVTPSLLAALSEKGYGRYDQDADVRAHVADILGSMETPEAFELLLGETPLMEDADEQVRKNALHAIGNILYDSTHDFSAQFPRLITLLTQKAKKAGLYDNNPVSVLQSSGLLMFIFNQRPELFQQEAVEEIVRRYPGNEDIGRQLRELFKKKPQLLGTIIKNAAGRLEKSEKIETTDFNTLIFALSSDDLTEEKRGEYLALAFKTAGKEPNHRMRTLYLWSIYTLVKQFRNIEKNLTPENQKALESLKGMVQADSLDYKEIFDIRKNPNQELNIRYYNPLNPKSWAAFFETLGLNKVTAEGESKNEVELEKARGFDIYRGRMNGKLVTIFHNPNGDPLDYKEQAFEFMKDDKTHWVHYGGHTNAGAALFLALKNAPDINLLQSGGKFIGVQSCCSVQNYMSDVTLRFPFNQFVGTLESTTDRVDMPAFAALLDGVTRQQNWATIALAVQTETGINYYLLPNEGEKRLRYLDLNGDGRYDLSPGSGIFYVSSTGLIQTSNDQGFEFNPLGVNPDLIANLDKVIEAVVKADYAFFWNDYLKPHAANRLQPAGYARVGGDSQQVFSIMPVTDQRGQTVYEVSISVNYRDSSPAHLSMMLIFELNRYFSKESKKSEQSDAFDDLRGIQMAAQFAKKHHMEHLFPEFLKKYGFGDKGFKIEDFLNTLGDEEGRPGEETNRRMKGLNELLKKMGVEERAPHGKLKEQGLLSLNGEPQLKPGQWAQQNWQNNKKIPNFENVANYSHIHAIPTSASRRGKSQFGRRRSSRSRSELRYLEAGIVVNAALNDEKIPAADVQAASEIVVTMKVKDFARMLRRISAYGKQPEIFRREQERLIRFFETEFRKGEFSFGIIFPEFLSDAEISDMREAMQRFGASDVALPRRLKFLHKLKSALIRLRQIDFKYPGRSDKSLAVAVMKDSGELEIADTLVPFTARGANQILNPFERRHVRFVQLFITALTGQLLKYDPSLENDHARLKNEILRLLQKLGPGYDQVINPEFRGFDINPAAAILEIYRANSEVRKAA